MEGCWKTGRRRLPSAVPQGGTKAGQPQIGPPRLNLILFTTDEAARPLPLGDPRARHLLKTLRRQPGDSFDAGLVNGPRGRGRIESVGSAALLLSFEWGAAPPALPPLTLLIGLPRPQTARDILRDVTTLGVAEMHFVLTEKGEPSYARSSLWTGDEWRRLLVAGAQQAFDTRLPTVTHGHRMVDSLAALPAGGWRVALDNYEASAPLADCHLLDDKAVMLAIGPERGWSAEDRARLCEHGFTLVHLGPRVLRTETAVVAAVTLLKARLGWV